MDPRKLREKTINKIGDSQAGWKDKLWSKAAFYKHIPFSSQLALRSGVKGGLNPLLNNTHLLKIIYSLWTHDHAFGFLDYSTPENLEKQIT